MSSSTNIAFVLAKGRSGTTLLQMIFNAHPDIIAPIESPFILYLQSRYKQVTHWDEKQVDRFIKDIHTDRRFRLFWKPDRALLKERIMALGSKATFQQVCVEVIKMSNTGKQDTSTLVVDKNPVYSIFTPEIYPLFPRSKYIHMVRDYRANVASHKKTFKIGNVGYLAHKWLDHNLSLEAFKKAHPKQVLTLRYEDLIEAPESTVRELCAFLEIDFHPSLMEHHLVAEKMNTQKPAYFRRHHHNVLNPLNQDALKKWQKELSTAEVELIEQIAGEYGASRGYDCTTEPHQRQHNFKASITGLQYRMWRKMVRWFYLGPFWMRRTFFVVVSKFFDKKHLK